VTIGTGDERKTYYTQQKIFNLSGKHAVGIMIYGDSEFMGIDWEIIINQFNKALGDRVFDTLKEYSMYFLTFLSDFRHITGDKQKECLAIFSYYFFREIKEICDADISENYKGQEISKVQQTKILGAGKSTFPAEGHIPCRELFVPAAPPPVLSNRHSLSRRI
jgi:hypothetical protein